MVGSRTAEKAAATSAKLQHAISGPITIDTMVADLSSFDSVRAGAAGILDRHKSIDILIHMAGTGGRNNVTADGFVETVEINHLSSALLTKLLLPALQRSTSPRVIYIGSANLFDPVDWTNSSIVVNTLHWIESSLPETSFDYYGLSKLLLANYAVEQARRQPDVTVFTVNPGLGRVDADNKSIYRQICAESALIRPCPQFPAQAVTSTFFAATQHGIEGASGSLIDFATNLTGGDEFAFVQFGDSCIPRPLPQGGINSQQSQWYDAVNSLLEKEAVVV